MPGSTDWRPLADDLADGLRATGVLNDPALTAAFRDVPRHLFARCAEGEAADAPIEAAYADRVIPTRFADTPGVVTPTSSLSQPTVVAMMLELLDLRGGERVLEIGTGVGYNAALLCRLVGDANVTSVDMDPGLVADARECLGRLDLDPTLVVGDGAEGVPSRAPFDRIVAACALESVPAAWLDQIAPDAVVVAPLVHGGLLMTLRGDGTSLVGRAHPDGVYFMEMRGERPRPPATAPVLPTRARLDVPMVELVSDDFAPWRELEVPGVAASMTGAEARLVAPAGHARLVPSAVGVTAEQWGEPVAEEVAHAWRIWRDAGRPGRERFGMTVTRDRQTIWLDEPGSARHWTVGRARR